MHPPVSTCTRRVRVVQSAYAVSHTQFIGQGLPTLSSIPRCTRRCQLAPVESAYAVSTQFVAEAESSSPPMLSVILNSSVRGCLRCHPYSRCTRRCQLAPVEAESSSPPTLSSIPRCTRRSRVVESAYPTLSVILYSSVRGCLRCHPYSRCTRRCQLAPVESAYAVSTQFVDEAESSSEPTLSVILNSSVSGCLRCHPYQDAPAGVNLHPSSPPTLSALNSSTRPSRRVRLRCQTLFVGQGLPTLSSILKMHPPVSTCTRRVRLRCQTRPSRRVRLRC
ncbi:hypothetical protein EDC01DRAFT_728944, partial [Geopyxis carbonaria]